MAELLVRAADAARFLGVHPTTLASWSERGAHGLPEPTRLGSRQDRYYPAREILALADRIGAAE